MYLMCFVCVSPQGDFTWNSVSGRSVGLKPVPLQSLSELERVRLQDVALRRLLRGYDLGCHITIPKCIHARAHTLHYRPLLFALLLLCKLKFVSFNLF